LKPENWGQLGKKKFAPPEKFLFFWGILGFKNLKKTEKEERGKFSIGSGLTKFERAAKRKKWDLLLLEK